MPRALHVVTSRPAGRAAYISRRYKFLVEQGLVVQYEAVDSYLQQGDFDHRARPMHRGDIFTFMEWVEWQRSSVTGLSIGASGGLLAQLWYVHSVFDRSMRSGSR